MNIWHKLSIATAGCVLLALGTARVAQAVVLTGSGTVFFQSYSVEVDSIEFNLPGFGPTPTGPISFNLYPELEPSNQFFSFDFDTSIVNVQAYGVGTFPLQATLGLNPIELFLVETGNIKSAAPDLLEGPQILNFTATATNSGQTINDPTSPFDGLTINFQATYDVTIPVQVGADGSFIVTDLGTINSAIDYEFSGPLGTSISSGTASGTLGPTPVPEASTVLGTLVFGAWGASALKKRK